MSDSNIDEPNVSPCTISVVVPTYNSERVIGDCLRSLKEQDMPPSEVIVCDGGSTDRTVEIARSFGAQIITMQPNRCSQRNAGAEVASGTYLLFIDSDMRLSPGVVSDCLKTFTDSNAALVIPEIFIGEGFWAKVRGFERGFYEGIWYIEAARCYRREQFLQIGGFDPRMVGPEDWDLDQRIRVFGPVVRTSALIQHNEGHINLLGLLRKKAHYAGGFPLFKATHPERAALSLSPMQRARLFVSKPKELLCHPLLSAGVGLLGIGEVIAARTRLVRRLLFSDLLVERRESS